MRLDWHGDPDSGSEELPGVSEANAEGALTTGRCGRGG